MHVPQPEQSMLLFCFGGKSPCLSCSWLSPSFKRAHADKIALPLHDGYVGGERLEPSSAISLFRLLNIPHEKNEVAVENLRRCNYCTSCRGRVQEAEKILMQKALMEVAAESVKTELRASLSQLVVDCANDPTNQIRDELRTELGFNAVYQQAEESEFKIVDVRSQVEFPAKDANENNEEQKPPAGYTSTTEDDEVVDEEDFCLVDVEQVMPYEFETNLEDECLFVPEVNEDSSENCSFHAEPLAVSSDSSSVDNSSCNDESMPATSGNALLPLQETLMVSVPLADIAACLPPKSYKLVQKPDGTQEFQLVNASLSLADVLNKVINFQEQKARMMQNCVGAAGSMVVGNAEVGVSNPVPSYRARFDEVANHLGQQHGRTRTKGKSNSEMARRADAANKLKTLKNLVPSLRHCQGTQGLALGFSKVHILNAATEFIRQLQTTEDKLAREVTALRKKRELLRRKLDELKSAV